MRRFLAKAVGHDSAVNRQQNERSLQTPELASGTPLSWYYFVREGSLSSDEAINSSNPHVGHREDLRNPSPLVDFIRARNPPPAPLPIQIYHSLQVENLDDPINNHNSDDLPEFIRGFTVTSRPLSIFGSRRSKW